MEIEFVSKWMPSISLIRQSHECGPIFRHTHTLTHVCQRILALVISYAECAGSDYVIKAQNNAKKMAQYVNSCQFADWALPFRYFFWGSYRNSTTLWRLWHWFQRNKRVLILKFSYTYSRVVGPIVPEIVKYCQLKNQLNFLIYFNGMRLSTHSKLIHVRLYSRCGRLF